jgi:hypothetical protein
MRKLTSSNTTIIESYLNLSNEFGLSVIKVDLNILFWNQSIKEIVDNFSSIKMVVARKTER